jgi:hypothetical protein
MMGNNKSEDDLEIRRGVWKGLSAEGGIVLERSPTTRKVVPAKIAFPTEEELEAHLAKKRREIILRCPENQQWPGFPADPDDPPWPAALVTLKVKDSKIKINRKKKFALAMLQVLAADGGWMMTKQITNAASFTHVTFASKPLERLYREAFVDKRMEKVVEVGMNGWKRTQSRAFWKITDRGRTELAKLEASRG